MWKPLELLKLPAEDREVLDRAKRELNRRYAQYKDPWGFDLEAAKTALDIFYPIYKYYFRVRTFGKENIQDRPYMLVSNHTGQLPIDGAMLAVAFATQMETPRIVHSMIERFMASLPFIGDLTAKTGSILGDRENCKWLLKNNETILVFPEGVRGISKNTQDFYSLQSFSKGFIRLAGDAEIEIVPIAVIGAEEMYPLVWQLKGIGKKLGLPSLPITPNLIPLPSPIDIYIGKPYKLPAHINENTSDIEINEHIEILEKTIKDLIKQGLKNRRAFLDPIRKPITQWMRHD